MADLKTGLLGTVLEAWVHCEAVLRYDSRTMSVRDAEVMYEAGGESLGFFLSTRLILYPKIRIPVIFIIC